MNDERLLRLEEKIAHLEHHVTAQDRVILQLSGEVAGLRRELAALRERTAVPPGAPDRGDDRVDERPPHY